MIADCAENTVRVWKPDESKICINLPARLPCRAVSFGKTAETIFATTDGDRPDASQRTIGWIYRWDFIDGTWHETWSHSIEGGGTSLAVNESADWLVTVNVYAAARLLDTKTGRTRRIFQEFGNSMNDCAINSDASRIFTAGQTFRIWTLDASKLSLQVEEDIANFDEQQFRARESESLKLQLTSQSPLLCLAPQGKFAAAVGAFRSPGRSDELALVQIEKPNDIRVLASDSHDEFTVNSRPRMNTCVALAFSQDQEFLYAGFRGGQIHCWNCDSAAEHRVIETGKTGLKAMALMPDGKQMWMLHHGSTPECWDLETGKFNISLDHK